MFFICLILDIEKIIQQNKERLLPNMLDYVDINMAIINGQVKMTRPNYRLKKSHHNLEFLKRV